jgi:heavy metal sensor kinase
MSKSIRGRLQLWYALVLLAVVAGFAGLLFYRVRAARFQEIDAELESSARFLDVSLRRFPPHMLDAAIAERAPPARPALDPDEMERPGRPPPLLPPRPNPERLLAELKLANGVQAADSELEGVYFAIWRADGSVLKAIGLTKDTPAPTSELKQPAQVQMSTRGNQREGQILGPRNTRILVGKFTARVQAELSAFAWQLTCLGVGVLAVGLAGGWFISARILKPLAAISATASAISAANLSGRIETAAVDRELKDLADVLNAMFDRLEAAFLRQAQFTADASHELRTPLAILRTHAELALSRARTPEEYQETLATCLRASQRMGALVDGLLTLARADAGSLELKREPVDLRKLVEENIDLIRPLAEKRHIAVKTELASVQVVGDSLRLGQVATNLLSNAIQYNRPGGQVHVSLQVADDSAVLSVADTGCGIPEEDAPHIFARFYRVDKARTRVTGGNGLGLAICKSIVEAHGGTIGFETKVNQGTRFWVRLACANIVS